jgi:hypothetical protein
MARPIATSEQNAKRFWSKVDIKTVDDCWEYQGRINGNGYGEISMTYQNTRKNMKAHRYSAELAGMDITDKLVCHTCDNRRCVNPHHLFTGSYKDNADDMIMKGRYKATEKTRKLTPEQIREIRTDTGRHDLLAKKYGISKAAMSNIKNRKTYREVI